MEIVLLTAVINYSCKETLILLVYKMILLSCLKGIFPVFQQHRQIIESRICYFRDVILQWLAHELKYFYFLQNSEALLKEIEINKSKKK